MPDDMSKYPNLSTVFDFPDVQALKVDGKFYFIPRGNYKSRATDQAAQRVMYYRKDWAQKLGLKEPETVEEFTEFVKAMKNGNPDGDGKVITGVVQYQMGNAFLDSLLFPFVPAASATWIKDEDGKSKPAFFTKGTVEAMKYLRKLYDEGLLDKDFAIEKTEDGLQKFANGRAAVAMWQLTGSFDYMNLLGAGLEKTYPGKKAYDMLGVLKPLKSENDGKNYIYMGNSFWSETYIKGDVDDKKADRILRFLDYTISDEFVEMVRYGLEGVDFKKEGSNYEIIREKDKDGNFVPLRDKYPFLPGNLFAAQWFTDVNMNDPAFYQEVNDEVKNFKDWASTNASFVSPDFNAGFDSNPLKERVKVDGSSLGAEVTKIIVSKEDVETIYNKIVDEYKKRGLDQLIDEVNKAVGN
jgi:putative aldouronate transport system substrate-binding protein